MKKINKVLASLLVLAIIGFTSCKKEEVIKVFGFVQGFVYDGSTNEVLDNVAVEWEVSGNPNSTSATEAEGFAINDLYSGYYNLVFSKEGYSTAMYKVEVPMDYHTGTARGGGSKEFMISVDPNLYPLTAGLTGRVYKTENSFYVPIEGATVRVEINNDNLVPNMYQTTTNADGYYTFTELPAYGDVTVRVLEYTDENNEVYYGTTSNVTLVAGVSTTRSVFYLSQYTDALKLINTNAWIAPGVITDEFVVSDDIVLEFNHDISEAISKERANSNLPVYISGLYSDEYTVTFSGNTVTINPDADLNASTYYRVYYTVYGSQPYGGTYSSFSFRTAD